MSGIKDVAKRAGVSISTVSNVINKSKYVSPELVKRVEEAVAALSYEVNPMARGMKSNRSGTIGVITEDMCGVFYPYIIKGINSVAMEKGYQIIMGDTQGNYGDLKAVGREKKLFRRLIASRVDGILFASAIPSEQKKEYSAQILKMASQHKNIPLVSLERDFTDVGIDSVYFDTYENSKMAVEHLVQCGCRKICHITGPVGMEIARERVEGYKSCLKEKNIPFNEELMIVQGDYSHQSGYLGMKKLLENLPDLDGVFCGNDQMAIGAIKYLKEQNIRIPQDIKLVGYDDVFISSVVEPSISTIHIKKRHTGIEAAKLLLKRIESQSLDEPPRGIKMEASLVVRHSTVADIQVDENLADW
ncbi:MAG TPA: LacI family DNA-binding transcriptional regulator [Candidatus Choladousia intestinavium]|uniref:LacI family DNA-binding transcriptional regulator n=1 Tax=Candidatus Choladousia intestinavium TaxID=2840727 RepID=A0A9D1DAA3_9FIRM|nr:LacI family DNA-binding transcriptional regulator [Candidatus Choladousia intestinavium]